MNPFLEIKEQTLAMGRTLIAIVDDDEAIRLSTCSLLVRAGFEVTLFKSGDNFLSSRKTDAVDCILLDVQMPGSDGLTVLRLLRERAKSPPVLIITAHGDIAVAVEAMKLGAHDFLEKPYSAPDLIAAIGKAVASGLKEQDARTFRSNAKALMDTLTQRQQQVLQAMLRGLQNKVIAFELGLSTRTVESYRARLLEKLGANNTADAVRIAVAAGLEDDSPGLQKARTDASSAISPTDGSQAAKRQPITRTNHRA